jgi:phage baseplate assembly protein W
MIRPGDLHGYLAFPMAVSHTGALTTTTSDQHLRDLILQVLFTEPGERVNLPEFGCGVKRLLFAANSDILRSTAQFLIKTNLHRWLGDRIDVQQVNLSTLADEDASLLIEIAYTAKQAQAPGLLRVRL